MATSPRAAALIDTPLRLWPGVAAAVLLLFFRLLLPAVAADGTVFGLEASLVGVVGAFLLTLVIVVWWVLFSRAFWSDRLAAVAAVSVTMAVTWLVAHPSIRGGMMGMMLLLYALPVLSLTLVLWALAQRCWPAVVGRAALVGALLVAGGTFAALRTDGLQAGGAQLAWRWTPTAEERLLASVRDEPAAVSAAATATAVPSPAVATPPDRAPAAAPGPDVPPDRSAAAPDAPVAAIAAGNVTPTAPVAAARTSTDPLATPASRVWPGFRGAQRDSVVPHLRIETNWTLSPPTELWRRAIGPGWSSVAISGDLLYTQEQRGDEEMVTCYRVSSGEPVWRHRNLVRFWESNGGAGPRGTPTFDRGRVYALGATGILDALEAQSGRVIWSRNVATDTGRSVPDWGFSSSPLVVGDVVIVAASGTLAAYDVLTGERRWSGPRLLGSYSSPHLATIGGVPQVLFLSGSGAIGVAPASGEVLWQHEWQNLGATIVQPAVTADGSVLVNALAATGGSGTRKLAVTRGAEGWTASERWTSNGLKPYFNDFVVHGGHAYGFDGNILASIDLATGTRAWKGGRYGNGQMLLLPAQDVLIVLSEDGELALVSATTERYQELARIPALHGKTWNHPVLVGSTLIVRNGEEMAAFRLAGASR